MRHTVVVVVVVKGGVVCCEAGAVVLAKVEAVYPRLGPPVSEHMLSKQVAHCFYPVCGGVVYSRSACSDRKKN